MNESDLSLKNSECLKNQDQLKVVYGCNTGVFLPISHPLEFLVV